jgi:hypothetical protein
VTSAARLLRISEHPAPADLLREWSSVIGHSHMLRQHAVSFEEAKRQLVAWCRDLDIAAAGTGAFLRLEVDGIPMGGTCPTAAGRAHRARLEACPVPGEAGFARIDFVSRGGRILHSARGFRGGTIENGYPDHCRASAPPTW